MIRFVTISLLSVACLSTAATPPAWEPGGVPYEITEAGRTHDDQAPVLALETPEGWRVRTENAVASLGSTTDHRLFGKSSMTLKYRATPDANRQNRLPRVYLELVQPLVLPRDFDTISIWCYGNNNYGKVWENHKEIEVPSTTVVARFDDGQGGGIDCDLEYVNHCEWFKSINFIPDDKLKRVRAGGNRLIGFWLGGGFNREDREICLTSFCAFKHVDMPLEFKPRAKRGVQIFKDAPQGINTGEGRLPFPTTERTILPPEIEPDSRLEFRFPKNPSQNWDDLAFRFKGGDWIPLAKGGGIYPVTARRNAQVKFRRDGNSVVAEIVAKGGLAEEVRFGQLFYDGDIEAIPVPYLTYRKGLAQRPLVLSFAVKGAPLFLSAMFDWTQSAASEPIPPDMTFAGGAAANGGVKYLPKTDGKRNDVYERLVWTVSPDFVATLPSIPNPVSPWKHVTGKGVWIAWGAGPKRENDTKSFVNFRRQGIRHLIVTDHETMWRDGNESFTFKTNAAPVKGGDAAQVKHTRCLIDELGYRYGPYNNFTDYAPVNRHWDIDWVGRTANGQLQRGWYRCYGPKPLRAVEACEKLSPVNQAKFKFNTAYCDVHTAVTPWSRTDYDARVPGAGTLAQVFYAYGEIMLLQKAAWNGPVYSEGGCQWPYWGLTDGNYAQDSGYVFAENPWLVDFDLRECHPKACDFGMGNPNMLYGDGHEPKEKWPFEDKFLAATVAFGHPGYFVRTFDLTRHSYFMIQGVAARYTQANASKVRYADRRGRFYDTTTAIVNGAFRESRVAVRYDDGTVVAANGGRKNGGDFVFRTPHGGIVLGPDNWIVLAGDGQAFAVSAPRGGEGKTLDVAFSEEYAYMHARGEFAMTAVGGTDGELVRDFLSPTEERVICREQTGEVVLPYIAKSITSIGYGGTENGEIEFTIKKGMTYFSPKPANWEIRVKRAQPDPLTAKAALQPFVVPAERKAKQGAEEDELRLPLLVRTGMIIRGEKPEAIDPETGARAQASNGLRSGGVVKQGYSIHPPYGGRAQGKTGAVFVEFSVAIPEKGRTVLSAQVSKSDNSTPGDGIFYRVEAVAADTAGSYKILAEKNVTGYCYEPISADLSEFAGQRIRIRLVADAGPANNPHGDGGGWSDLKIRHY